MDRTADTSRIYKFARTPINQYDIAYLIDHLPLQHSEAARSVAKDAMMKIIKTMKVEIDRFMFYNDQKVRVSKTFTEGVATGIETTFKCVFNKSLHYNFIQFGIVKGNAVNLEGGWYSWHKEAMLGLIECEISKVSLEIRECTFREYRTYLLGMLYSFQKLRGAIKEIGEPPTSSSVRRIRRKYDNSI